MTTRPSASPRQTRVHLVSGPSSCGKSTFLRTFPVNYDRIIFPKSRHIRDLGVDEMLAAHYNIFRPYHIRTSKNIADYYRRAGLWWRGGLPGRETSRFGTDTFLQYLLYSRFPMHATVLVAPREVLLERVSRRTEGEPLRHQQERRYANEKWITLYRTLDLSELYLDWLRFLEAAHIAYDVRDASDEEFRQLHDRESLFDLIHQPGT